MEAFDGARATFKTLLVRPLNFEGLTPLTALILLQCSVQRKLGGKSEVCQMFIYI